MKLLQFFWTVNVLFFGIAHKGLSQDPQQPSNFVVIGVFAKFDNAVRFTNAANQDNFRAQYAIQTDSKLYYVFILNAADQKKAFAFVAKIRGETKYKDAWVYMGKLGETAPTVDNKPVPSVVVKPVEPEVTELVIEELPKKDSVIAQSVVAGDSLQFKKPVVEIVNTKPVGKPFYFKLINSESGSVVLGEIHIVESKATQYQAIKGNELVYLMPPKNNIGVYQVSIQAPGYKLAKLALDYENPSAISSSVGEKQETIITFELVRAVKGDYIDFNNVRFFSNSNILEPGSQSELEGLTVLMKDNQQYKIKVYGHCNGKESREIVTLGSSTNFFALDAAKNKKETVTPKQLTEYRAEAIKSYLVSQGIDQTRITTKGEGAKMMIYPSSSTLSNHNDRVEIKVLKAKK